MRVCVCVWGGGGVGVCWYVCVLCISFKTVVCVPCRVVFLYYWRQCIMSRDELNAFYDIKYSVLGVLVSTNMHTLILN